MMNSTSSPASSRRVEDPYSPIIVDDLLSGTSDWRNIQDIIRLTMKAMSDVMKAQGNAIRDLERQLPQKLSKTEAQTLLSQKVSTSDLSHHLAELQSIVESRGPMMDLQAQLEQKVSRGDLNFVLSSRPTVEEVKTLMEGKASNRELDAAVQTILAKLEDQAKELSRRLSACALDRDVRSLEAVLQEKANQVDVEEALTDKASKQMVSSALSRKVNASDVEVLLSRKADVSELQSIMNVLENKAEVTWAEQLTTQLQSKAEASDLAAVAEDMAQKATKREVDELHDAVVGEIRETIKQLASQIACIDEQTSTLTTELDRVRTNLTATLSKKVENKDMDKLLALLSRKADEERMTDLLRIHKTELSDLIVSVKSETRSDRVTIEQKLAERTSKLEADFRELLNESIRLRTQFSEIQDGHRREQDEQAKYAKNLNSSLKLEFSSELFTLKDQVESLMKAFGAMSKDRATVAELMDVKSQFQASLSARPSLDHVQSAVAETRTDLTSMLQSVRDDFKSRLAHLESDLFEAVDKKAGLSEMQAYLGEKADSAFVARLCSLKATSEDFEDLRRIVEGLRTDVVGKANKTDLDLHVSHTRNALEEAAKDIVMKANIKDVCTLLDLKANIDDVNKALQDLHSETDRKANHDDYKSHVNEQALLNEALCAENMVGRWIWKSGEVRVGNAVPWEVQTVNTFPDNFLWEREKTAILTVAPGLYEITFGFFAARKPTVQLLVNGEVVLSAVNSASYVVHHSSGRLRSAGTHSSGNVAGLTLVDFLALPARARVSITYTGDADAEGFLGLRKL